MIFSYDTIQKDTQLWNNIRRTTVVHYTPNKAFEFSASSQEHFESGEYQETNSSQF